MPKDLPARRSRLDADALTAAARQVAPQAPPAQAEPPAGRLVILSMRMTEATVDNLARAARANGESQRQMVARALRGIGVEVAAADLKGRPPPRRRGEGGGGGGAA